MSVNSLGSYTSVEPTSWERHSAAPTATRPGAERQGPDEAEKLTEEEQREVQELERRDREVKSHEMAHVAAGGQYVRGGASYEYDTGPDGKRYATGGEVSIDTSPVKGDPEQTIRKMQTVRKAALAPAQPSARDRAVAAKASQQENRARQELTKQQSQATEAPEEGSDTGRTGAGAARTKGYTKAAMPISYPFEAAAAVRTGLDLIA